MKNFKILIVEDNGSFRQILNESLRTSFPMATIYEAADGREALRQVEDSLPDFIIMDIGLPGENGLQLTRKIKSAHPNIIILVLTNLDLPEYQKAALQHGADCFLGKSSLSSTELKELVKSYDQA